VRTGAVLFERSGHDRLPPASLTKMATALVAMERGAIDQSIVASERTQSEPRTIGMEPGDSLPLREALYGLLLESANDAALAIAESVGGGSIDRFVGWMNVLARSLDLADTHFENPNGLDTAESHVSSALDMARLARTLLAQPTLRQMVAEPRHLYQGPPLWAFRNINPFLGSYPGADGVKTGYETRAGRCIAASATRDGRQLIAVLLNSPNPSAEAAILLNDAFARTAAPSSAVRQPPAAAASMAQRLARASGQLTLVGLDRARLRSELRGESMQTSPPR
jgi:D-alanyl-D-alanine carboxypeptidase